MMIVIAKYKVYCLFLQIIQLFCQSPQRDSTQGGEMSVAPGNGTLAPKN